MGRILVGFLFLMLALCSAASTQPGAREIVERSIANNDRNWAAAPQFTFEEKDVELKASKRTIRTYQDLMIDGSPCQKLIGEGGEPLSPEQAKAEDEKLARETARRRRESPEARRKRIEQYLRERRQDHELMQQMMAAFEFRLISEQTVDGRRCYVLAGTPRPDYRPINRDTEVLRGMRGQLWVDTDQYQWVKVHAEMFRPVAFGLFIAHVRPGTEFTLEEAPVGGGIWEPARFTQQVKASVLFWSHNSSEYDSYLGYRPAGPGESARR